MCEGGPGSWIRLGVRNFGEKIHDPVNVVGAWSESTEEVESDSMMIDEANV